MHLILFNDWNKLNLSKCLSCLQQCISCLQVVNQHIQHATVWPDQLHHLMSQELEKESTFHYSAWNNNRSLCSHIHLFLLRHLWWDRLGDLLAGVYSFYSSKTLPIHLEQGAPDPDCWFIFHCHLDLCFCLDDIVITIVVKNDMKYITRQIFTTINGSSSPHTKSTSFW